MKKIIFVLFTLSLYASDSLVSKMCSGIDYSIRDCPMDIVQDAIQKGVNKIELDSEKSPINFSKADAFHNKDKFYPLDLKFAGRISEEAGLFVDKDGRMVYIENLPKNVRFFPKGEYVGFVKGEGAYKIKLPLTEYEYEMIPKGKIISIKYVKYHWR